MSLIDDILGEAMLQDAMGMFDKIGKELTQYELRDEWLGMDEDERCIFSQKGMGMKI